MYEKHEMNVVAFEESCVFADLDVSGGPEGGVVEHSVTPETGDK